MKHLFAYIIFLLILVTNSYAQTGAGFTAYSKRDSVLFYNLGLDKKVCPMLDFDKTYKCYQFLKRFRVWERSLSAYSGNNRDFFDVDEEYESLSNFGSSWEYEYAEGDTNWKTFAPEFQKAYDAKHGQAYNEEKEKKELVMRLEAFYRQAACMPLFYNIIEEKYKGSVTAYVNDLYKKSMMTNGKMLKKFLRNPSYKRLDKDMGAQMSIALKLYQTWLENHDRIAPEKMGRFVCRPSVK